MAKLIAAWSGLMPETQIALLAAKKKRPGPAYLYRQIIEKALTSENAFVRYLAAIETRFDDRDERNKALIGRIDSDPEPLVRYARHETDSWPVARSELRDPEKFFAIPHEAQLATVRKLTDGGEGVAKLISYAVEHQLKDGRISEVELFEILSDYLDKPEFKNQYKEDPLNYHGWSEYIAGKDIEALWGLVLKLPEDISHVLIEHLPESAGLTTGIPKHVLDGMSDGQLSTLFYRSDIGLESFRKQKFFEAAQRDGEGKDDAIDGMRMAAITHAFDLTNEEFAEILAKPDKPRVKTLKELSIKAGDLRLCLFEAIHDALFALEVSASDYEDAEWAMTSFERKLEKLRERPDKRDKELKELRLYRLATQAVPWKKGEKGYPPSGELAFLEETIVEGDTWATFAAFSKKWGQAYHRTKGLEKYFPRILEAGEEDDSYLDEDVIDDTEAIAARIANKESEPFAKEEESTPTKVAGKLAGLTVTQEKMLEALNAIKTEFTELRYLQGKTLEAVNAAKAELTESRRFYKWQRVFTWIVIGLLVVLLIARR